MTEIPSLSIGGNLHFRYQGRDQTAPFKLVARPLNARTVICDLDVTYAGRAFQARFNVVKGDSASQVLTTIKENMVMAMSSWPAPWPQGVSIKVAVTQQP